MPLNTIPNKGLTSRGYPSDRLVTPIIINGDMSVAQRGTSATGIGNGDSGYHTCDRWNTGEGGATTAEFTQSQSTDVPTGQGFAKSFKMDCTTADTTLDADIIMNITHKIEGQNLQMLKKGTPSAESVTLSFWVKSSKTGTYVVNLYDNDNNRRIQSSYTVSSASTWEKKILTFSGDTTGTFGNDNNTSLEIYFQLFAGSDYTGGSLQTSWGSYTSTGWASGQVNLADSTSNEWYITGVQLEVGEFDSTTLPSFPFESHESNLRKCERYYEKNAGYSGFFASNSAHLRTTMKTPKRTQSPSISFSNSPMTVLLYGSSAEGSNSGSSGTDQRSISFADDAHHIRLLNQTGTGASNGNGCILTDSQYVIIDAEL